MDGALSKSGERFVMRCRWKGGITGSVFVDDVEAAKARAVTMRENFPGDLLSCEVRHYVDAGAPVETVVL